MKERKDRVDDALHATRAAVEEGIVPGGGTALLYATKALDGLKGINDDQTRGIDIIRKAITAPLKQIAQNAGHDGAVVAGKLIDGNDTTLGFNASTDVYENLVAAGVIDPTKVVRTALQDAASVAGLLITTEAAVSELPEDKPAMPPMGGKTSPPCPPWVAAWAAWAAWTSKSFRPAGTRKAGERSPAFRPSGARGTGAKHIRIVSGTFPIFANSRGYLLDPILRMEEVAMGQPMGVVRCIIGLPGASVASGVDTSVPKSMCSA